MAEQGEQGSSVRQRRLGSLGLAGAIALAGAPLAAAPLISVDPFAERVAQVLEQERPRTYRELLDEAQARRGVRYGTTRGRKARQSRVRRVLSPAEHAAELRGRALGWAA